MNISKRDIQFITEAYVEANKSILSHKHGALLVSGSKVLSRGHNTYAKPKIYSDNSCTCHAEVDAIGRFVNTRTVTRRRQIKVARQVNYVRS